MRIAQVMLGKGFGGAERSFVDIARALAARGHDVLAIGERRGVALGRLTGIPGIACRGLRCHGSWDVLAGRAIGAALAEFAPAVVHTHLARAAHLGGRAARALAVPSVAKTHNLVDLKYYRAIDCLVPTTAAQAEHLRAHGVDGSRIVPIANFSALSVAAPIAAHVAGTRWRLKALGRLVHKKGFDTLIEACARLAANGLDFTLDVAGDGPERARLAALIARHALGDRVALHGWADDVAAFLEGGELFVLPSRDEPFGIVVLEAMACGVPVLATRTQGPCEILSDATGYLVEADDPVVLAEGIVAALNDDGRLTRAAAATVRFVQHYSVDVIVDQYVALYERLVG